MVKAKKQFSKDPKKLVKHVQKRTVFFIIIEILTWLFSWLYIKNKKRIRDFSKTEEKEVYTYLTGKESAKTFWSHTKRHLKDFFIPHEGNNHKPKSLHTKSLITYVVVAIIIKAFGTGFLFVAYPTTGEMARIVGSEIIELVNSERKENGLPPLRSNTILTEAALKKGMDMLSRNYFAHDTPDGQKPWAWIDKSRYDYVYAGENLAMDFTSAELIHRAFMASQKHKKNILNHEYLDIGIAIVTGEFEGRETELLVQFFGTTRQDAVALERQKVAVSTAPTRTAPFAQSNPLSDTGTLQSTQLSNKTTLKLVVVPNEKQAVLGTSKGVVRIQTQDSNAGEIYDTIIFWMNVFFSGLLIFLCLALLLNIVIKFHIQHGSLIMQALAVIAFVSVLFLTRWHFAQDLPSRFVIL